MTQIGLLVPRSAVYPTINFDLVDGLKCSLATAGISNTTINTAGIGVGGSDKEIYSACEKLLFDGVEIVAAYINPSTVVMLQPLFVNAGALLIVLSPGYQIPPPGFVPVNTYTISLDGVLACRILPALAVANGDTEFAFTCSFFDAGYRAPYGFFNGLQDVGAQVVFNHPTQLKKADFTLAPLTEFLKQNQDVAIMAASCGDMTTDLFEGMKASPEYANHHCYGAPFVAEEIWLAKSPYPGSDITAIVPWASGLDTESNQIFTSELTRKKRTPNVFSLLSWEAGMVVAKVLETDDIAERLACLENYTYTGPRGTVVLDSETHTTNAPLYKTTIVENKVDGKCMLANTSAISADLILQNREKLWQEINSFEGVSTSWFNVYGCLD